ncbi:MAG: type II toxin-antitoxin system RelE/ParE family toxin [Dehalococcoidia bacterium]|nr:type II toxin-antitoxin system RelE/ParE family toxin [Dehalococcoidia bacterium]
MRSSKSWAKVTYSLTTARSADRDLRRLEGKILRQVATKIISLAQNPRPQDVKLLHGLDRIYRVASVEYRILYTIDDDKQSVVILHVKNRREAYRNL